MTTWPARRTRNSRSVNSFEVSSISRPGAPRAPPEKIELQIPDLQCRGRLRACLAAQQRLHAREQLDERERLGEIVIAARAQAAHAIIHIAERREHEHRRLAALLAQELHDRKPIHVRQHAIGDDGVELPSVARDSPSRPSAACSTV